MDHDIAGLSSDAVGPMTDATQSRGISTPDTTSGAAVTESPPVKEDVPPKILKAMSHVVQNPATQQHLPFIDVDTLAWDSYLELSFTQHSALGGSVWSLLYEYDAEDRSCAGIAAATGISQDKILGFAEVGKGLTAEQQLILLTELTVGQQAFQRAVATTRTLAAYGAGVPRGGRFPVALLATINQDIETPAMRQHRGGK